ncbi:MAG: hypothetical protein A2161_08620 [Candidatus Schekmanbacteria bacterium RBG_13_48_7]|uniref:Uncharacterized protein n=1 Tax=Candidatus Schekmanbacteria bacterium RBG_13_48_7 TaxID=1817878 RepID=A0A1F7RWA2_9BACT|nr:MAG: hypothetical protein A2161_08620 [Candidatus Schekmanbacteria bacterium RBG_13_48_7]
MVIKQTFLKQFKPAVPRIYLLVIAGLAWSGVGLLLCWHVYDWLKDMHGIMVLIPVLAGIMLSLIVFHFGFSRIARKNIDRICQSDKYACIFSFQEWKSYVIITVMIASGVFLRRSTIPKHSLAVIYLTIGCALFFSSLLYFNRVWKKNTNEHPNK